jgi:hypothetical protein
MRIGRESMNFFLSYPWAAVLADSEESEASIFFWSLVLLVLVIGFFVAVAILRKKMSPNEDFHGIGFTLSDLRQLHKKGQMSDEEYEKAKIALLGSMKDLPAKSADTIQPKDLTPPG